MCGICGLATSLPGDNSSAVKQMNDSLAHRGPDGEGFYNVPHLAMAMRRLSIIGLDDGWQPIYNEDSSLVIIANGEIYNYIELRVDLEKRGHRFNTHSDVETILHLYEEHGPDCVKFLRGMFAFALWDEQKERLMLARDRLGEKPLYLFESRGELYFASEMKALLKSGVIPFEFDPVSINDYFHYQYVPEPRTPIKGVRKLAAGHIVLVDTKPWTVSEKVYWSMQDIPPLDGDPATLIRAQLEELSALVIRSDVPVGIALSGGLDSSIIAALTSRKYPGVMQAFSVGYPGRPDHDERQLARELATHLKMPFNEIELSTEEQSAIFSDLVFSQDDPIADISGFGYYAVSRKAREQGVPVLLQGQGGDELFWGYKWVRQAVKQTLRKQAHLQNRASFLDYLQFSQPASLHPRALAHWALNNLGVSAWKEYQRDRVSSPSQMIFMDMTPDFMDARANMSRYYSSTFPAKVLDNAPDRLYDLAQPWPNVTVEITRLITQTYLLENGIAQGDRLGMANSIELRLPFMDYRLVETVIGLRRSRPDHQLPAKSWLKDAVRDLLPAELLARPKRGFQPPVRAWHENLFQHYGHLLQDGKLVETGILSVKGAESLSTGYFPEGNFTPISFKALVLEMWARRMAGI